MRALVGCGLALVAGEAVAVDLKAILLGELEPDTLVVTDLTPAGRDAPQPTAEKPVYYYYREGGFRELGERIGGEEHPDPTAISGLLVRALQKRHYLRATRETPPPSIIVTAWWGTIYPGAIESVGTEENEDEGFEAPQANRKQMLMIVGGSKYAKAGWINFEMARVLDEATEDRYFVFVSAYDAQAALRKEKKPLWFTRISVPARGVSLGDVMASMALSGAPHFGKETKTVEFVDPEKLRKAEVKLGETIVVPEPTTVKPHTPAAPAPKP